jgi:hypothetical protein
MIDPKPRLAIAFRWQSWLGLSVALFLVYGALNLISAIAVPVMLQLGVAGAAGIAPVFWALWTVTRSFLVMAPITW